MSLANVIKQISENTTGAGYPVAVMLGTVSQVEPLEILVDQRFKIDEDFLIITERVTKQEFDLKHRHDTSGEPTKDALIERVVVREGLNVGDGVVLLRVQGGQQFVVLDKVVS